MPPPLEITHLISSAQRLQSDLIDFQIPRLRICKGPLSLQQNLAAEVREDVGSLSSQVEALELAVGDLRGERARKLDGIVTELKEALEKIRQDSRAALLASKHTIDSQSQSQRDELFASSALAEKQNGNEKDTDEALMKANADVTEALRRTIGLMQSELERSVLSVQMLDSSTATLRSTSSTHDTLTSILGTSKQLVTALEKTDWLDRVLILSAFVFFVLVVLFIVKERFLDKGVRMAFWWTRFIPDFSGDEALLASGVGHTEKSISDRTETLAIVTSVVWATTSLVASVASPSSSLSASVAESEDDEEDKARRSVNESNLETIFTQLMAPVPEPESTIVESVLHDDTYTSTRTLEHDGHVVDEL